MSPVVLLGADASEKRVNLGLALLEGEAQHSPQRTVTSLWFHGASVLAANQMSRSRLLLLSVMSFVSVGTCFFLQERARGRE